MPLRVDGLEILRLPLLPTLLTVTAGACATTTPGATLSSLAAPGHGAGRKPGNKRQNESKDVTKWLRVTHDLVSARGKRFLLSDYRAAFILDLVLFCCCVVVFFLFVAYLICFCLGFCCLLVVAWWSKLLWCVGG